jgi:hypothetical protein
MERYDIVCIHTIVGHAPAHAAHFSTHHDGRIVQSRDTRYRSAANLNGNHRVLAVENEDMGPGFPPWNPNARADDGGMGACYDGTDPDGPPAVEHDDDAHVLVDVPPLTEHQVEACARILAWAHATHGVPLQLCPDSRPGSRGLAYHRQGIDGNWGPPHRFPGRVPGGEVWTLSRGKECPDDRRIAQLPAILSRAEEIVNGDNMPLNDVDKAWIKEAIKDAVEANNAELLERTFLNEHEPKGEAIFRGVTVRQALKDAAREEATKRYRRQHPDPAPKG